MHIQINIHPFVLKILRKNTFWSRSRAITVKNWPKIMCISYNMDLVYINAYTKFYQNSSYVLKILRKNTFLHQSRAITLLFINKFSPVAIPYHSSLISMSMQSLKKIGQQLLKSESRNEALTDRWRETDKHSNGSEGYNIIPRHFLLVGIKIPFNQN